MAEKTLTGEIVLPSDDVVARARVPQWEKLAGEAEKDLEAFWAREASELHWFSPWKKVLDDSAKPFYKWFIGGTTNISYNCLDRHVDTPRRNKLALLWEGEKGEFRSFSYFALRRETCRFANVLKSLGVQKGDRITIYMGRIPELAIAMLACARIGAVHSVVYGGFTVEALHERLEDSQSKVLIVADGAISAGEDRSTEGDCRRSAAAGGDC